MVKRAHRWVGEDTELGNRPSGSRLSLPRISSRAFGLAPADLNEIPIRI